MKTLEPFASWPKLILSSDDHAGRQYDLWGRKGPFPAAGGRPVVNMGYWAEIRVGEDDDLERASDALFELVAGHADFSPADRLVLDVGCGFGTMAILCAERFSLPRVVGVNVSGVQLAVGRRLVANAALEDRVEFLEAGATELPFADASADKIVSVEAAFHFPTRERFFSEVARVLKPGRVLSMVDLNAPPPEGLLQRLLLTMLRHSLQVPADNIYPAPEYLCRLEGAGLELLETENLYPQTFPPFRRWVLRNCLRMLPYTDVFFALGSAGYFFYPWDYLRIKARRPDPEGRGSASVLPRPSEADRRFGWVEFRRPPPRLRMLPPAPAPGSLTRPLSLVFDRFSNPVSANAGAGCHRQRLRAQEKNSDPFSFGGCSKTLRKLQFSSAPWKTGPEDHPSREATLGRFATIPQPRR